MDTRRVCTSACRNAVLVQLLKVLLAKAGMHKLQPSDAHAGL